MESKEKEKASRITFFEKPGCEEKGTIAGTTMRHLGLKNWFRVDKMKGSYMLIHKAIGDTESKYNYWRNKSQKRLITLDLEHRSKS